MYVYIGSKLATDNWNELIQELEEKEKGNAEKIIYKKIIYFNKADSITIEPKDQRPIRINDGA